MPRIGLGELFQAGGGVEGIGRARERRASAGPEALGIGSPFGGTKQSGLGYRNGEEGYKEYLDAKTIGMPE